MRRVTARAAVATLIVSLFSSFGVLAGPAFADTTDVTPPAQVSDLRTTPSFQYAYVYFTKPADPDFAFALYAISPGSDVPDRQSVDTALSPLMIPRLSMGTEYTLAVWSEDRSGNVSDPVVVRFTTLLDTQPPHPVTGLTFIGGAYNVTARWTPPTDPDLGKLTVALTDDATGTVSSFDMAKTATGNTWRRPGGRSYTVAVTATDVNGLVSDVSTATARTDPDANGAPPPIAPSTVILRPTDSSVMVSFPRPAIPDLGALAYALVPVGQDPLSVTTFEPLDITSAIINRQLLSNDAFSAEGAQLVLRTTDLNGNSTLSVVPGLRASSQYLRVPPAPAAVTVASPGDNTLDVGWTSSAPTDPASWTITAVSGAYSQIMTVPGTSRQARLTALAGQRNWTVGVAANNEFGSGGGRSADPVTVAGALPPPPVTRVIRTPAYDSEVLTWTNPSSADFDHVEVMFLGALPAETRLIYRGRGSVASATGLVAGRTYSFEIRTFDRLGRAAGLPATVTSLQSSVNMSMSFAGAVSPGSVIELSGHVTWNGGLLSGRSVSIQSLPVGASVWRTVATGTTAWPGTYIVRVQPSVTTRYRAAYRGSARFGGSYSPVSTVPVLPPAAARMSRPAHRWTARAW
ncbi:MAG: hypothetical protein ACXVFZ_09290 [Blastococcus sp.]